MEFRLTYRGSLPSASRGDSRVKEKHAIRKHLHKQLRELKRIREELGLTQEELADELGVHRVTVGRWEIGERGISELAARLIVRIRDERGKRRK